MPEFETYVDVDVDEYWDICSRREKDELIDLIDDAIDVVGEARTTYPHLLVIAQQIRGTLRYDMLRDVHRQA